MKQNQALKNSLNILKFISQSKLQDKDIMCNKTLFIEFVKDLKKKY